MTSNSQNMTLEDKLVQDIKENKLGALIGDEDALAVLAKRAIDEALFKDQFVTEGSGYNRKEVRKPSRVSEAATLVAEKAISKCINDLIEKVLTDPDTNKIVVDAVTQLLPSIVMRTVDMQAMSMIRTIQLDAIQKISSAFMNAGKFEEANIVNRATSSEGLCDRTIT